MEKRFEATALNLRVSLGGMKARSRDLSTVAQKGDMKLVEKFLKEDVDVDEANATGQSQLYVGTATFWGFYDVVRTLVEKGISVNAQNKKTLWTPLHAAAFQEHGKIIMFLIERGAKWDIPDSEGRTAKDFASASDMIWSHFAAAGCPRTSKRALIEMGIIRKGQVGNFSNLQSAYGVEKTSFQSVNDGDVLADPSDKGRGSLSSGTSQQQKDKPNFSVWKQ